MYYEVVAGVERTIKDKLNDAIIIGPVPNEGLPLGALTLIFNTPAQTVTFSGSAGDLLRPSQIKTALLAVTGMKVDVWGDPHGSYLSLYRTAGFIIDSAGTSNELFRLSTAADTESLGSAGVQAVVHFEYGAARGHYTLILARGEV